MIPWPALNAVHHAAGGTLRLLPALPAAHSRRRAWAVMAAAEASTTAGPLAAAAPTNNMVRRPRQPLTLCCLFVAHRPGAPH